MSSLYAETTCNTPPAAGDEPLFYDHVVIGCGGIGSATLHYLTKLNGSTGSNQKILGIEQFALGHANGSSHDRPRAIRYFYHDVAYMHMVRYSFDLWDELESETGLRVVHQCGVVWFASIADAASIAIIDTCYKIMLQFSHEQQVNQFQPIDEIWLREHYPNLRFPPDVKLRGVYDPLGGFVDPVTAVQAFQDRAQRKGAEVWEHSSVIGIKCTQTTGNYDSGVPRGENEKKTYSITVKRRFDGDTERTVQICTENLYLCTGAWTSKLFYDITNFKLPMTVTQEQLMYIDVPENELPDSFKESPGGPGAFFSECGDADMKIFYGFPSHTGPNNSEYVPPKIAVHATTDIIDQHNIMSTRNFGENPELTKLLRDFVTEHMPLLASHVDKLRVKRCLYSLTPDYDMVVDNCGFFGHSDVYVFLGAAQGFKFAPLIGKYFALSGTRAATSAEDQEIVKLLDSTPFLKLNRPALVDQTYKPKNCWL